MYYVGADLGATNVRAVVGDETAAILGSASRNTPRGPNGIAVTEAVLEVIRKACTDAGIAPSEAVAAGVGSIGPLDLAEGVVNGPANLPDTVERIPLVGPVGRLLDTDEVYLHNDTIAGVIGERFHSERNPDDMVYLTISSGIGAGVAVDGNVLSGWDGNAGEVGHMTVDPHGFMTCGCGLDGHWEGYCSGNNIPSYARELHAEDPIETSLPVEDPEFSAVDVFEAAGEDTFADHVIDQLAHWNAMGIANIIHAYAPLVVSVGGAVALNNPERVLDPIRKKLPEMVFINVPEVRLTDLGDEVVVKGALASALTGGTGDRSRVEAAP
ncbi:MULTISPECIES: ROK family protein [Halorubrum]|uniref:Glucokinase n=1 Tax=Halorubrum sodomense TaxID=35743 RepID=A0A1I6FQJ2_HALSD|nr:MULTISPECIES: ROK family protein [Halorubrum]TKX53229.1 ROK family protein [Halorubrum sp. SP3]TKX70375.1 ROK family protein [Halorubrum sp. SP9]SFR32215.1 glucokinase [Halorubrum sodomense]